MVDTIDLAQDITENAMRKSMATRPVLTLPFSGSCLSCNEPIGPRRYCDSTCRDNHEAYLRRRMISPT